MWPLNREHRELQRQAQEAHQRAGIALLQAQESVLRRVSNVFAEEDVGWDRLGKDPALNGDLSASDLAEARRRCLRLWVIDPTLAQAANLLRSGAIGDGVGVPRAEDEAAQTTVDEFWQDPDNVVALTGREAMSELNLAWMLAGERFWTLHTASGDPRVKLAVIPPEEITEVICHPENAQRPLLYARTRKKRRYDFGRKQWVVDPEAETTWYRDMSAPDPENPKPDDDAMALEFIGAAPGLVPGVALYHSKINTIGKRGIPEAFRVLDWSRAHAQTLQALMTLTKALAQFAWKKKVKTNSADTLAAAAALYRDPVAGDAAVHISNEGIDLEPVDIQTGQTSNQTETARQLFLEAIRSQGFGEHWYGDANTGNLATATAMELPAIWRIGDRQADYRLTFEATIGYAIQRQIDFGRLPQGTSTEVAIAMPPAQRRDNASLAVILQALTTAHLGGTIPVRTAMEQALESLGVENPAEILDELEAEEEDTEPRAAVVSLADAMEEEA